MGEVAEGEAGDLRLQKLRDGNGGKETAGSEQRQYNGDCGDLGCSIGSAGVGEGSNGT